MSDAEIIKKLSESVIEGEKESSIKIAEEVLSSGIDPVKAIKEGLLEGLKYVGDKWVCGDLVLPELMESIEAMRAAMDVLKSKMAEEDKDALKVGTIVLGTVLGDIHDIGKAQEVNADIIGMSARMVTSMPFFDDVIDILKEFGIRNKYKVLIGGGPVTQEHAEEIGADGYGKDAEEAVRVANKLLGRI